MDVQRYLAEEPIVARPPSAFYRVRKAVRRHRLAVLAAAAAAVALISGTIVSTWEAIRARRAEWEQIRLRQEVEAELNRRSGEFEAKHGHWKEAVPFYQKAIELIPSQQEFYHDLSALLAEMQDLPVYRETCRRALAAFGQTTDPRVAERMTKDCLVLSITGVDTEVLSRVAQVAVTESPQHLNIPWFRTDLTWFQLAKGLAEYRCGRFTNALTWLEKSLAAAEDIDSDPGRVYVQVQGRAVLAITQVRLGRGAEAQATLEEATRRARAYLPELSIHGLTDYWPDWIYAQILIREASQELDNAPSSTKATR
jgi:tetratricopeptide (TPR) repeat protein